MSAAAAPTLRQVIAEHRALVCVGTGGVGKTTIAASLALAGARQGRRTAVLTIDPARQLARALGLASLSSGERVEIAGIGSGGSLHAGMLDQKAAWDAFISRHAPTAEVRDTLLGNSFYQKLSTSFAGSTEYMAIEELCRLDESGAYDLIVIDTPPAGHAVDFVRAPERIEGLLDPEVAGWLSRPYRHGGWRAVSTTVRFFIRLVERAFGTRALREVSAFLVALDALFADVGARAARARALLHSERTAFVLVVGAKERILAGAAELSATMQSQGVPLRAAVINRVQPFRADGVTSAAVGAAIAGLDLDPETSTWLARTWSEAAALAEAENRRVRAFASGLPPGTPWISVPELDHDAHSLADLAELARLLGATD